MFSSFFKPYFIYFSLLLLITLFFTIFIPVLYPSYTLTSGSANVYTFATNGVFPWPTPGYTTITSPFGRRNAPTSGASTFHSGIDIGAPSGTNIIAVCPGIVTFLGFNGAGGYTITIKNDVFVSSYCHVSPNFIVSLGQQIKKGQVIGKVGPKNVYGVPNNPYRDINGTPTNGATTGPHLHLTLRKDGELVNPLDYLRDTEQ